MRKRYGVLGLLVVVASLTGCAASAPAGTPTPTDAEISTEPPQPQGTALPGASATTICADLSNPASLAFTAADDFRKGSIDEAERNGRLTEAAGLFQQIDATSDPGLSSAIASVRRYIDAAEPDASGQPFDAASDDFANLLSGLGAAGENAGSQLTISAHGG